MRNTAKLGLTLSMALFLVAFGACSDGGEDAPVCGNGQVEAGETCDGNCPAACDDDDVCTVDTLGGSADTCNAVCSYNEITTCTDDDGCCPSTCTEADDNDCSGDPCEGITDCIADDGCCPTTCDHLTDNDCSDPCADVTACIAGDGCCPADCTFADDNDCDDPCADVTDCIDDDGCCPESCDVGSDNDCTTDPCFGIIDCIDDDTCCPEGCDSTTDNDCTADPCDGVIDCIDDDTCCPEGCDSTTDNDCTTTDPCFSIASLREAEDEVVMDPAMPMCPAYVTYITDRGFFLQTDPEGPAIYSFEGWGWNDDNLLALGDYITMPVVEVESYFSQKQIKVHAAIEILGSGNSLAGLIQDLSSGILPSEELECELIHLTGATITLIDGSDLTIAYGTATNVNLYVDNLPLTLCIGATFDFLGLAADFDGVHNLRSYDAGDFSHINTDNCPDIGQAPVAGDLLLNEFMADPANDLAGDANCDGIRDSNGVQDEFVEIVNVSGEDLDLSGVTIADEHGPRHTFTGFSLPTGGVVVVFGGGSPNCNWHTNVLAVVATSGALGLNNGGDTITLTAADGSTELLTHTYGNEGGNNESLTLIPDLNTGNPYVGHSTADTVDGSLFSPGATIEGGVLGN